MCIFIPYIVILIAATQKAKIKSKGMLAPIVSIHSDVDSILII